MKKTHFVIIPAAGSGSRFNANCAPKQYHILLDKPVIAWTIGIFTENPNISQIVVVVAPDDCYDYSKLIQENNNIIVIKNGGETRAESVKNGLDYIIENFEYSSEDLVLIHDAARCCLHRDSLSLLLQQYNPIYAGAILAKPVTDSLKNTSQMENNDIVINSLVSRDNLYIAETPQIFKIPALANKITQKQGLAYTDEASLFTEPGTVQIIINVHPNPKVTYQYDIPYIELLIKSA